MASRSARMASQSAPTTEADAVAHVLRRIGFGPFPGQVDELTPTGAAGVLQAALAAEPVDVEAPDLEADEDRADMHLRTWWLDRMSDPVAGLHEKLVWYWHGHFTSSMDQVEPAWMWQQQQIIRRHALGDFRAMVHELTLDPAMLVYLDGDGSIADQPNENYGRELMELFTLGRGQYEQSDVAAAARALAGWWVDWETGEAVFERDSSLRRSVQFLGRSVRTADDVVDAVCDHEACAPHVAGRLHEYLVGFSPSDERRSELGRVFRDADLQLRPLVEAILHHPDFMASAHARPRLPIEWLIATLAITGWEHRDDDEDPRIWWLESLGQIPFEPPNVAGWPIDDRWLSASQWMSRASILGDLPLEPDLDDADPVGSVLALASITTVGDATRAALDAMARRRFTESEYPTAERNALLLGLALNAPEFALA